MIVIVAPYLESHNLFLMDGGDALRYLGLLVFLIGYLLMVWAPLHLGKQFSAYVMIQEGHELITDGPFRHMRHHEVQRARILGVRGRSRLCLHSRDGAGRKVMSFVY